MPCRLSRALGREHARDFRADLRRVRAAVDQTPFGAADFNDWLRAVSSEMTVLAARLHDAQHRLPAGDATGSERHLVARCGCSDDSGPAPRPCRVPANRPMRCGGHGRHDGRADCRPRWSSSSTSTELDFLFDRERHLFAIGYNVTEGRRDPTYYDALASEARLASFVAIAMRHVPQEHWFKLGRLMTAVGPHRALVSWSASMFEYLMPLLVMRSYPRTLLYETYHAVISRHIEYAKAAGIPWGISESAYNVQDARRELSVSRFRRARNRSEARPRR